MLTIRPANLEDLGRLEVLAVEAGDGMTNLPADSALLEEKIRSSSESFARAVATPGDEFYLFILEDGEDGAVVGCCGIIATVGLNKPFYSFKIVNVSHTSRELDKYESVSLLQMADEYRGATEIAMLYLTPAYRRDRNGRLLSLSRLLYIAEFPRRFAERIMAEMRGVLDERGHSVFWDKLGRHFFDMDFSKADYLSSQGQYQFIADLMPKYPVYIRLLPEAAQAVIGVTHEATRPALELLKREGFRFEGCVDVFDAGPAIHCPRDDVRTVRESERGTVTEIAERAESRTFMISNTRDAEFRVTRGALQPLDGDELRITHAVADALRVGVGDVVRYMRF